MNRVTRTFIQVLALAMILQGCATLRVDVDVYKGPLANSEEVQVEQMASMAIAARPLLIELRDRLEAAHTNAKDVQAWRDDLGARYTHEFMNIDARTAGTKDSPLLNENALRVNGVLSLYLDSQAVAKSNGIPPSALAASVARLKDFELQYNAMLWERTQGTGGTDADFQKLHQRIYCLCMDMFFQINVAESEEIGFASRAQTARHLVADLAVSVIRLGMLDENSKGDPVLQELVGDAVKEISKARDVAQTGEVDLDRALDRAVAPIKGRLSHALATRPEEVADRLTTVLGGCSNGQVSFHGDPAKMFLVPRRSGVSFSATPSMEQEDNKKTQTLDAEVFRELLSTLRSILSQGASGLEKGRLADGIETLIVRYLTAADRLQGDDLENLDRQNERERLEDALVHFANKVLVIANNDILFRDETTPRTTHSERRAKSPGITAAESKDLDEYVLVLQSIGNSILVQIDELTQRRAHRETMADGRGLAEREARNRSFPAADKGPQLGHPPTEPAPSVSNTMDSTIALLRYQYAEAVTRVGKDADEAKFLKEALDILYEQRSGSVYIRPSMAYLRSSYPASALQEDPRLGWRNMLARHSLKSIPLFAEGVVNSPEKNRIRIMTEIDKQYWQTINSVKVNGAGRTNYVVTKDDIGNWYVKGYSANPEDIIKGAQSLALFSMGGHFQANTFDKLRQVRGDKNPDGSLAAGKYYKRDIQRNQLERSMDSRVELYLNRTASDRDFLRSALSEKGAPQRLKHEWKALAKPVDDAYWKALEVAIDDARKTRLDPAAARLKDGSGSGSERALMDAIGANNDQALVKYIMETATKQKADPYAGIHVTDAMTAYYWFIRDLEARTASLTPAAEIKARADLAEVEEAITAAGDDEAKKAPLLKQKEVLEAQLATLKQAKDGVTASLKALKEGELLSLVRTRRELLDRLTAGMQAIQNITLN